MSSTPGPSTPMTVMEYEDDGHYDEKSDGEGMSSTLVVEEGGGGVGVGLGIGTKGKDVDMADEDGDGEDEDAEGSEKGDDYAEWDVYEQEV